MNRTRCAWRGLTLLGVILSISTAVAQPVPLTRMVPRDTIAMKATFAPVVEKAAPAVVNIYTKRIVQTTRMRLL